MTLTPEIIARLQSLQSLLELRDWELVETVALRLEIHRAHDGIELILDCLRDRRYSEASALVARLLSEGARLVQWTDPEIALLEAELEKLTADLAELEMEQAEIAHLLAQFQAAFDRALGDRIARLLELRMKARQRQAETEPKNPKAQNEYEEARHDYEQHRAEQEALREKRDQAEWTLSEEERQELKRLYRAASKRCHPDVVPPEHHDAAAAMFRDLNEAYQSGDLERVHQIAERAAVGLFEPVGGDEAPEKRKERLRAQIAAVRESLARTRADLEAVRESATYRSATAADDWEAYFGEQGRRLDEEIEHLSGTEPLEPSRELIEKYRIGEYELQRADYRLVCWLAGELGGTPEETMDRLIASEGTRLELDGQFLALIVGEFGLDSFEPPERLLNLEKLWCHDNNLTELDLTAVPNLEWLWCHENSLTELDLTAVPHLESLYCYSNNLKELDLAAAPNLKALQAEGNNLTELDCPFADSCGKTAWQGAGMSSVEG